MSKPGEKRQNALITLAFLAAVIALVVPAVGAIPGWLDAWQNDLGYTREQLEDVERTCEAELDQLPDSDHRDARFERCEEREKFDINPDPFSHRESRRAGFTQLTPL